MPYDPKTAEPKWQAAWEEWKIHQFDPASDKPVFSIDNPPRYANAALHLGHATSYTQIDFAARYHRLRGENVYFPLCADVNGMPIEVAVEKKHKVNKRTTDRQTLVKLCSEFARENITEMTRQFRMLGHSMDPTIYYQTDSEAYRRITQLSFLRLWEKGFITKKLHPVSWCPSCETALASADIEYEERTTHLNYINFGRPGGGHIPVATTRPELLCACQLIAVHPEDARYKAIVGKHLRTPIYSKEVQVVADEKVDPKFGSGVVMICTIGDKGDLEWIQKYKIPIVNAIDARGKMTDVAGADLKEHSISVAREQMIRILERKALLVQRTEVQQNVGSCWRCHTPVEYLNVPQWFLKTLDFRDAVMKKADEVTWHPEFMKTRLRNWVESLAWDWCLSRQRYFATAIPVWECEKCWEAVPAKAEQCYVDPLVSPAPVEACPKCGGKLIGCPDVFDTWMDSSITPLFCSMWLRDDPMFQKLFPMSLRPQSHDIIRTWAFYTILRSLQLVDQKPWDHIMISGFIMAPDGSPMHTSKGNIIDPLPILAEHGADAFRYFAASCSLGMDHPFQVKQVVHGSRLAQKIFNSSQVLAYAFENLDAAPALPLSALPVIDRWLLSTYSKLISEVTAALDEYQWDRGMRALEQFFWHEFADHYLELVKPRVSGSDKDMTAIAVLYEVGLGLLTMFAVFQPHVTEEVYQTVFRKFSNAVSIHAAAWPNPVLIDDKAEKAGGRVRNIIAAVRAWKSERKILPRELAAVEIVAAADVPDQEVIRRAVKAKELHVRPSADVAEEVVAVKPVQAKIGPHFRDKAPAVLSALASVDPKELAAGLAKAGRVQLRTTAGVLMLPAEMVELERRTVYEGHAVDVLDVEADRILIRI